MSRYKPTKNSVWICARLINENPKFKWPFKCSIEKVAWVNYHYSSDQRENGAVAGGFYNTENGELLFYSEETMRNLLTANRLFLKDSNHTFETYIIASN